jgi:hypothetical protein
MAHIGENRRLPKLFFELDPIRHQTPILDAADFRRNRRDPIAGRELANRLPIGRYGSKPEFTATQQQRPLHPNQQTYRNERPATGAANASEWRANPASEQRPPLRSTVPGQI